MTTPMLDNVTDAMLDELVKLWEVAQENPSEPLNWSSSRSDGKLVSLQEIADLIPVVEDEFLTVAPPTNKWYTQCLCVGDRWVTECATWDPETQTVHNYRIGYEDRSDLKFAAAYSVMAEFCRSRGWAGSFATKHTEY